MGRHRYDNGTFCGDKRIGRLLVALVTLAAWLVDRKK